MCFQGFKTAYGAPSPTQEKMLSALSSKMTGWSLRGHNRGIKTLIGSERFLKEAQITLRSALVGIKRLDRNNPVVRSVLVNFAEEILTWSDAVNLVKEEIRASGKSRDVFDKSTVMLLSDTFGTLPLSSSSNLTAPKSMQKDEYTVKKLLELVAIHPDLVPSSSSLSEHKSPRSSRVLA